MSGLTSVVGKPFRAQHLRRLEDKSSTVVVVLIDQSFGFPKSILMDVVIQ